MTRAEKACYEKKMHLYKMLGAEQFQKVVFAVEDVKFKILKKLFPNFLKFYNKICNFNQKRELNKANSPEEYESILMRFKFIKMHVQAEWNSEKNRNYHINVVNPTEMISNLKWNKSVHKNGLIRDGIVGGAIIILTIAGVPYTMPFIAASAASALLNFECINLQNYNICRYKKVEKGLKKREKRAIEKRIRDCADAESSIAKTIIDNDEKLPSIDEIIGKFKTVKQKIQMLYIIREELSRRGAEIDTHKQKVKMGGNENGNII